MRKLFLFLIIALIISSCAGTPKSQELEPVEETPPLLAEPKLAVLPVETIEIVEETPPLPAEPEIVEPVLVELPAVEVEVEPAAEPETVAVVVPDVIPEVISKVVQNEIPETIDKTEETVVIAEVLPPTPTEAPPPTELIPPMEMIPPVVITPPVPPPEPDPPQVAQVLPPPEEEPPAIIPALPLFEDTGPLPALSGQYGERELLPGTFSRIVQAMTGQIIEIPFRGSGWLFLGEAESRRGIAYESRRADPEGQSFIFRADAAGVYALKFYRQDFVRNYILNDQVQVIVSEAIGAVASNRNRVIAEPRWPSAAEEAQVIRNSSIPASPGASSAPPPPAVNGGAVAREPVIQPVAPSQPERTPAIPAAPPNEGIASVRPPAEAVVMPPAPPEPPPLAADEYLKQAKTEFDATRVAQAISLLDQFTQYYPPERTILSDELYWLYGQFYEASSPSRNILLSLDYYRRLINEYPQSSHCNDARRRISYLERYFINNR